MARSYDQVYKDYKNAKTEADRRKFREELKTAPKTTSTNPTTPTKSVNVPSRSYDQVYKDYKNAKTEAERREFREELKTAPKTTSTSPTTPTKSVNVPSRSYDDVYKDYKNAKTEAERREFREELKTAPKTTSTSPTTPTKSVNVPSRSYDDVYKDYKNAKTEAERREFREELKTAPKTTSTSPTTPTKSVNVPSRSYDDVYKDYKNAKTEAERREFREELKTAPKTTSTSPTTPTKSVNVPSTKGLPSSVQDLISTGRFFGDIFTKNVTPRTIDTSGIDQSVRDAQAMFNQGGQRDPFVNASLSALQNTYNQAGQAMGQEDALLNYITQGALRGFTPEQMQVARESAQSEIDRALQGLMRGAMGQGANLGVFGSDVIASAYPGMRLGMDAMANLERDLFLRNIERQDALASQGIQLGDAIRKRRFGELMDSSGNLFQGTFSAQEADRNDRLNRFENLANMRNAQATYQGMNNDSLNAFELAKVGAFTGGLGFADAINTNKRVLDLQKNALNMGSGRRTVSSPALATSSRTWNTVPGPTNNSSMAGSQFS